MPDRILRAMDMPVIDHRSAVTDDPAQDTPFLPVMTMAREGRVRGLLLVFDPSDRKNVVVTYLYPPASRGESLRT